MIDWLTILLALVIIAALVGVFVFMAWKINIPDPLLSGNATGNKTDANQLFDSVNSKNKKDKSGTDSKKKKLKDVKKVKRENKEEEEEGQSQQQQQQQRHVVKFKVPSVQTSEETDNEREESEQESSTPSSVQPQVLETSSTKARRRKNKARATSSSASVETVATPAAASNRSSGHIEGILANKDEKSPVTTRPQQIPHPKLATGIPKDEVELAKQHQQQTKPQGKSSQGSNKQTATSSAAATASARKPATASSTNTNEDVHRQQQQQEQPFTTVGGNRHKAGTPPAPQQQQQQQQQNKTANAVSSTAPPTQQQQQQQQNRTANVGSSTTPPAQQQQQQQPAPPPAPAPVQHEQLAQRQPPRQQKETLNQVNGFNSKTLPPKQPTVAAPPPPAAAPPARLADLVKALPTSQIVTSELMFALDAVPLSTDELNIIMQKIANKQAAVKQEWSKLQHGQKVDPQAHIGQVLDETARAYEEDMKTNAMKRLKELNDECNNDKRRINDLYKELADKDNNIQVLHAQLNAVQHPQQQLQNYHAELKRINEENIQLKQHLAQQQQQFSSLNLTNNANPTANTDASNVQLRVMSEQMRKVSIDNANYEKQLHGKDALIKEAQKEKEDILRSNQQLSQKIQESQKQYHLNEEKLIKELNENRSLHMNQVNDLQRRLEQSESENERLRREEIVHVEPKTAAPPALSNEEREKFEQDINQLKQQLANEHEQYMKKVEEIQTQQKSQENELRQQIEQLKKDAEQRQQDQTQNNELAAKTAQIEALQAELEEAKATNDSRNAQAEERQRQDQDKQKQFLIELLDQDVRSQLPNDTQDLNQWLSSYQQILTSSNESNKKKLQEQIAALKEENDQLHQNMSDVEKQLKVIEQTVQSKEELLLTELRSKDAILENFRGENEQLSGEMQRLRDEIERLQSAYQEALNESHVLKRQLDERSLVNTDSPSTAAASASNVDESAVSNSNEQQPQSDS